MSDSGLAPGRRPACGAFWNNIHEEMLAVGERCVLIRSLEGWKGQEVRLKR